MRENVQQQQLCQYIGGIQEELKFLVTTTFILYTIFSTDKKRKCWRGNLNKDVIRIFISN